MIWMIIYLLIGFQDSSFVKSINYLGDSKIVSNNAQLLDTCVQLRGFNLKRNLNLSNIILDNPDTLLIMCKDSLVYYLKNENLNEKQLKNKLDLIHKQIQFIKEFFFRKEMIEFVRFTVGPRINTSMRFYGYGCIISYKNISNNSEIDFIFKEIKDDDWRLEFIQININK